MSCEEFEQKILDYQEEGLSPIQRQEVETHLAECATCRSFAREWQRLDRALSVQIEAPALSADFDRRLRERIHGASQPMPEAERAERKRQMQAEFESGIARLRRGSSPVRSRGRNVASRGGRASRRGSACSLPQAPSLRRA